MNINQIKLEIVKKNPGLVLESLNMARQFKTLPNGTPELDDKGAKVPDEWLSHWDNDMRIRVTMHENVMADLKANRNHQLLAYKTQKVEAKSDANGEVVMSGYTRYVIMTPTSLEVSF